MTEAEAGLPQTNTMRVLASADTTGATMWECTEIGRTSVMLLVSGCLEGGWKAEEDAADEDGCCDCGLVLRSAMEVGGDICCG